MIRLSHKHQKFLNCEQDEQGNYIFSFRFADKLPQGELVEVHRLSVQQTKRARQIYKQTFHINDSDKNTPKHRLMGYLAAQNELAHKENRIGPLDGKLTPRQIADAKRNIIPAGFEIHHLHPISLGGANTYKNLYLLEHGVHTAIHRCMDCVLAYIPYIGETAPNGKKVYIRLPVLDKCLDASCGLFSKDMMADRLLDNPPNQLSGQLSDKSPNNRPNRQPSNQPSNHPNKRQKRSAPVQADKSLNQETTSQNHQSENAPTHTHQYQATHQFKSAKRRMPFGAHQKQTGEW